MAKNTQILNDLMNTLPEFNSKQRMIALDIISSKNVSFKYNQGILCIFVDGGYYSFTEYVRLKCNCN